MSNLLFFIKNNYSWIIWFIGTFALSYFILHNTQWLIGDDAIVMNRTGSGIPFSIYDQIVPEAGRFFPLAYYAYNILLLFNEAAVTVLQHYFFVSISFVIFSFYIFKLSKEILYSNVNNKLLADTLSLLFTFMMLQRAYSAFSYLFGTIWIDFLLLVIFIYYVFRFIKTQKTYYAIIAFLAILYCIFCIEVIFIIPAQFSDIPRFPRMLYRFLH